MDQQEFEALLERGKSVRPKVQAAGGTVQQDPASAEQPPAAATPNGETPAIDLEALTGAAEAAGLDLNSVADLEPDTEEAPEPDATALDAQGRRPDGTLYSEPPKDEQGLGDASGLDAIAGGGLKSVFETKDFLFGDTPPDQRSDFRASVEGTVKMRSQESMIDGVSAGVAQFAGAMFGLGKFSSAAKMLPWFGKALSAGSKGKTLALETGKAATAGAVAFDPWEERLSNLLAGTPIDNAFFQYLAADPDDSAMEGRFKAALESIALDATLISVFTGGAKVYKYLRAGDEAGAARVVAEQEEAMQAAADADLVDQQVAGNQSAMAPDPMAIPEDQLPPGASSGEYVEANADVSNDTQPSGIPSDPALGGTPEAGAAGSPEASGASGPSITGSPAEAAASDGADLINPRLGRLRVTDEDTAAILRDMEADDAALAANNGSHKEAIDNGYSFGHAERIPYEKLNNEVDLQNFLDRVVETKQEAIDRAAGGAVLTDARVESIRAKMADLYNEDPAMVLGAIQKAGRNASEMVAYMETGFLVTSRIFQDAHALAARIQLGDYTGFGNREGAVAELRKQLQAGVSVYGATRSIVANSGRAVRRMRWEFSVDPLQAGNLASMDGDELLTLVASTGGDARKVAKVAEAKWYDKSLTGVGWLLINNLVSGPKTQLINLVGNAIMTVQRPMERMIGAGLLQATGFAGPGHNNAFKESLKQTTYLASAFTEGFGTAVKAFMRNDSILSPHNTEQFQPGQAVAAAQAVPYQWKPWDSVGNILENALNVATKNKFSKGAVTAIGLPTRLLGGVDELVKQTTYRSKVMAQAHIEGMERAAQLPQGTTDEARQKFLKEYVRSRVEQSVDAEGRALDAAALREAQIATFNQELLPSSLGRTVQGAVSRHPSLRFILPFVKTPTNVLRYGWKMTPGLNLLQTEYRQMLSGKAGPEAQAQAVGQMALGTLYMGSVAAMLSQGTITGGGPTEWSTNSAMQETGYQPYSIVAHNEDGTKTYIPYNRYDPVAMPIGIMADLSDALEVVGEENSDWQAVAGALGYALARQLASKTYLTGVQDALDVFSEPDPNRFQKWLGRQAGNLIPYSAMLRQINPDPHMREVRTMTDRLMAGLPGFSDKVPPKYDWMGNPRTMRKGLWSSDENLLVDNEIVRLGMETDFVPPVAQPNQNGVDLRDVTMSDGENAYAAYQRLSAQPVPGMPTMRSQVAKMMQSKAYRDAPDGAVDIKGTRPWLLHKVYSRYRTAAMKMLKRDPKIRDAFGADLKKAIDHYSELRGQAKRYPEKPLATLDAVREGFNIGDDQ